MATGVVLDTSVVLNLLSSGHAERIITAMAGRCIVVAVTSREVLRHPLTPNAKGDPLQALIAAKIIERVQLADAALPRFMELTGASPPDDLDDGEAAALAMGELLGLQVALDETKGRRIAGSHLPGVRLLSSCAILSSDAVATALGEQLAESVFSALLHARMRVLTEHDEWVRELLGPERAAKCPSLRKRSKL